MRCKWATIRRSVKAPTVPSTMFYERKYNPYMRAGSPEMATVGLPPVLVVVGGGVVVIVAVVTMAVMMVSVIAHDHDGVAVIAIDL